jgi:hypothetical protein
MEQEKVTTSNWNMYFGNAYVLSWDETIEFYSFLEIVITVEWKSIKQMNDLSTFFYWFLGIM